MLSCQDQPEKHADRPGPHVCINALTHGDGICAARAVATLLNEGVRLIDGTLSPSFANVEAFSRFDRKIPEATRWGEEDMNRDGESMDSVPHARSVIAHDGKAPVVTPCDDCVRVMPAPKRYQSPGMTAVRLGLRKKSCGDT